LQQPHETAMQPNALFAAFYGGDLSLYSSQLGLNDSEPCVDAFHVVLLSSLKMEGFKGGVSWYENPPHLNPGASNKRAA
jgi:hypothetical protein